MLKHYRGAAVAAAGLLVTSTVLYAAGNYSTYPIVGGASFCVSTVGVNGQAGNTGQGGGAAGVAGSYCAQTVPAGPATFSGTEIVPLDTGLAGGASPQSAVANINQLGQGVVVDSVASGASVTIPANAQFFVLDTGTAATVAVTMPAVAIEGQIQHLVCGVAVATALSVAANTGQTIKGNSAATCTAGQSFAWRYVASANGLLVANTWLRIQ